MTEATLLDAGPAAPGRVLTVALLNRLAREHLESAFPLCWVAGEISNLVMAASGHAYFSLKDGEAQVRCVMFRTRVQLLGWRLENGMHVEARALVTLYEARGDFQLNVEAVRKAGVGNLYEQFLRLKEKLQRQGFFASESKRPLPVFPRRLGIVTSPQAAALRDVLTTLARRAPHVGVVLYPTLVQGEAGPAQIVAALEKASERGECDIVILCRGGGSLEDLWAFNDEAVACAIRACRIPVITGIGHETDFTIADFVADHRAATPTAAAELAAPERSVQLNHLADLQRTLMRQGQRRLQEYSQRLDILGRQLIHPGEKLAQQRLLLATQQRRLAQALRQSTARGTLELAALRQRFRLARPDGEKRATSLNMLSARFHHAWHMLQDRRAAQVARLETGLASLNPEAVLARGYSIVTDVAGNILRSSGALEPNDRITVSFHAGCADAVITSVQR